MVAEAVNKSINGTACMGHPGNSTGLERQLGGLQKVKQRPKRN